MSVFRIRKLRLALLLILILVLPGCKHRKVAVQQTIEDVAAPPSVASMIHMGDPKAAGQLISGFHDIENHAWRWTMRQFSVVLRPPPGSAHKDAVLTLNLTVPPVVLQEQKAITIFASIDGHKLPDETWSKPGEYAYKRDVPASLLTSDTVRVDFVLDKAIPPGAKDARELGIVVARVGLEPK